MQTALVHQQRIQQYQVVLHGTVHLAGVDGGFHQPVSDGVEFVVLFQFQGVEIAALYRLGEWRGYVADIDQLFQLGGQALEQPILCRHRSGLIDGFTNPLLHLAGENDAFAHQSQQVVH